jgi:hypothetical protein
VKHIQQGSVRLMNTSTTSVCRAWAVGAAVWLMSGVAASAWADSSIAHQAPKEKTKIAKVAEGAASQGGWVTARQKHNASGMNLRYRTPDGVKLGQRAQVALVVSGVTAADGAQIELKASDPAMTLTMNGNPVNAPMTLAAGEVRSLNLDIANAPEGLHYVTLYMTQNGRTSVVAVPVKVGHGQSLKKPDGQVQTTPSGEKIIVLPSTPK